MNLEKEMSALQIIKVSSFSVLLENPDIISALSVSNTKLRLFHLSNRINSLAYVNNLNREQSNVIINLANSIKHIV